MKSKLIMLFSFFCLFVVLEGTLVGCSSSNVLPLTKIETVKTVQVKEVVHDTFFQTKQDSSYYKAWLECKDGKVIIKGNSEKAKSNSQPGKYLKPPNVTIKDNQLQVDCYAEAQKLFAQWKDTYTLDHTTKTEKIPVYIERELTIWQTVEIWSGRLLMFLVFVFVALGILRFQKFI